jgi:hypothetical protein
MSSAGLIRETQRSRPYPSSERTSAHPVFSRFFVCIGVFDPINTCLYFRLKEGRAKAELCGALRKTAFPSTGPRTGVRVVSAFAIFSTCSSARVLSAALPDALTERTENRLILTVGSQAF